MAKKISGVFQFPFLNNLYRFEKSGKTPAIKNIWGWTGGGDRHPCGKITFATLSPMCLRENGASSNAPFHCDSLQLSVATAASFEWQGIGY